MILLRQAYPSKHFKCLLKTSKFRPVTKKVSDPKSLKRSYSKVIQNSWMEEILSFEDIRIPQVDQVGPRLVEGHVHFSFFHLGRHRLGQERSYYAAYVRAVSSRMGWGKNSHVTVLLQLHHTWCVCVCVCVCAYVPAATSRMG